MSKKVLDLTCVHPEDFEKKAAAAYEALKDSMGRFRTQSLFYEHRHESYSAPFTLKDQDYKGRVSMYQKYMDIGDPTEYTQAIALLGSWRHWTALCQAEWFKPHVKRWRDELHIKLESDRFRDMAEVAEKHKGTTQGVSATKWLADRYTEGKPKRGRPSKTEVKNNLKRDSKEAKLLSEEAERLGIVN